MNIAEQAAYEQSVKSIFGMSESEIKKLIDKENLGCVYCNNKDNVFSIAEYFNYYASEFSSGYSRIEVLYCPNCGKRLNNE